MRIERHFFNLKRNILFKLKTAGQICVNQWFRYHKLKTWRVGDTFFRCCWRWWSVYRLWLGSRLSSQQARGGGTPWPSRRIQARGGSNDSPSWKIQRARDGSSAWPNRRIQTDDSIKSATRSNGVPITDGYPSSDAQRLSRSLLSRFLSGRLRRSAGPPGAGSLCRATELCHSAWLPVPLSAPLGPAKLGRALLHLWCPHVRAKPLLPTAWLSGQSNAKVLFGAAKAAHPKQEVLKIWLPAFLPNHVILPQESSALHSSPIDELA